MDIQLRRIIPKAAGTYFIVRDNSQVQELELENKMRLFFINVEKGPVNIAIAFAKGDTAGFQSIFGKPTRKMRKTGNFSIDTCLDALSAGPITVINLREFDNEQDLTQVTTMNANNVVVAGEATKKVPFASLFTTNTFWTPKYDAMNSMFDGENLLQFANVGKHNFSIFVVKSYNRYKELTNEGEKSLASSDLQIEEFPALVGDSNPLQIKVKDTFVDVYLFNNTFGPEADTNKYYGHLFGKDGVLPIENMLELTKIPEAGFAKVFTGSLIPNLKSEGGEEISINTKVNMHFMETGLICDINEDVFENEYDGTNPFIDVYGDTIYDFESGAKKSSTPTTLLSHILPEKLTTEGTSHTNAEPSENAHLTATTFSDVTKIYGTYNSEKPKEFIAPFEYGIRAGNTLKGKNESQPVVEVIGMEILGEKVGTSDDFVGYKKVKYILNGEIDASAGYALLLNPVVGKSVKATSLISCKARPEQIIHLSSNPRKTQEAILNQMISPGIVRGVIGLSGIRYVIDTFKSYVEAGYKFQIGSLLDSLDKSNKFVRAIINEPFIHDMMESNEPLLKDAPNGAFNLTYLDEGGNKTYSASKLEKFSLGSEYCFFYGPGYLKPDSNTVVYPLAGKISNLFYDKENAFDVVANETGLIDGVSQLEYNFDDVERMYLERFRYNPVVYYNRGTRIYQNLTGYPKKTSMQQIHNSELLAFIKENLEALARSEAFKKASYDDYLRTETEVKNFMSSLALAGAIESTFVVICNEQNNTKELQKNKIKLVHVEYTPLDALDKVVFDLHIN